MSYELVARDENGLVRMLKGGKFKLRTPILSSSVDDEVRRFLENDAVKLLDVIGNGPLLYAHDNDILTRVMIPDNVSHTAYFIPGAEFYLGPDKFSMRIFMTWIPVLTITESGQVDGLTTTAHHEYHHTWEGLAKDKVLFDSLRKVITQDSSIPLVRLESNAGPIMFYKANHKFGEYARRYMAQQYPRLLESASAV